MELSPVQVSGGFAIPSTSPGTVIARVPANARAPAVLTAFNRDGVAIVYLKWIPMQQTGQVFNSNDAGIVLAAGISYTWDNPPRDAMLVALSTVANSIVAVDGSWSVPTEAQLL